MQAYQGMEHGSEPPWSCGNIPARITLQAEGIKIAVASNLAAPYAAPVRRLFPTVDAYGFSFAIGAMKPDPFLYRATCELLGGRHQLLLRRC